MSDITIDVHNVTKTYKLYERPSDRLKEVLHPLRKNYHTDFDALSDVSFNIKKGEIVGILGRNGAGKSTLLKIITGITTPTSGTIRTVGKIASLLELGAGFNPEYTGLENIYFQGTLMGFSRQEMKEKITEILNFADIGEFIHQPVKMYSSGMFTRLAFSISINVDPDILIIDEALSVGDMAFQEKSILKMKSLMQEDRTILFVSHNLPSIRNFCNRAIWLETGKIRAIGDAPTICEQYESSASTNVVSIDSEASSIKNSTKAFYIKSINLSAPELQTSESLSIALEIGNNNQENDDLAIGILVHNNHGELVTLFSTSRDDFFIDPKILSKITLNIPQINLLKGDYFISVSLSDKNVMFSYDRKDYCAQFTVRSKTSKAGLPVAEGVLWNEHDWML